MADQLTDDQISEFKEAFSLFDKDGDEDVEPCHRPQRLYRVDILATQYSAVDMARADEHLKS